MIFSVPVKNSTGGDRLKIGIARGLYYHEYGDLWQRFFEALGHECVLSAGTFTKTQRCSDEACLPVKAYFAYTEELLKKDVDCLFTPQIIKCTENGFTCPKVIGINAMLRASLKPSVKLISPAFDRDLKAFFAETGRLLGERPQDVLTAIEETLRYKDTKFMYHSLPSGAEELTVCLLGHKYMTEDSALNMDIRKRLAKLGIKTVTASSFSNGLLSSYADGALRFAPFWITGRQAAGLAALATAENAADAYIYLTAFGCGPDSFIVPLTKKYIRETDGKPFLEISLDGHSAAAGLDTRLEAFADMLQERTYICS